MPIEEKRPVDARQRETQRWFVEQDAELRFLADRRTVEVQKCNLQGPRRIAYMRDMGDLLETLRILFRSAAIDIPSLSTPTGYVHRGDAEVYVEEEFLRNKHLQALTQWAGKYREHRRNLAWESQYTARPHMTEEETICADAQRVLNSPLSALSDPESFQRSCYIIECIQRKRREIVHSCLRSPFSSTYRTGANAAVGAVTIAHGGLWSVLGEIGLQYIASVWPSMRYRKQLAALETRCKETIDDFRMQHSDKYSLLMRAVWAETGVGQP